MVHKHMDGPDGARSGWGEARSKQVAWHDPHVTGEMARRMPGRAFLQGIIDGEIAPPPIGQLLGFQLISVGDGEAVFRSTPDSAVYNPIGAVHGGWICTLLDSAAGCAVHTRLPAGVGYTTVEIKVSFLEAVRVDSGAVEVTGRALRVGRQIAFAEAHARDERGHLVGHATSSLVVLRARER